MSPSGCARSSGTSSRNRRSGPPRNRTTWASSGTNTSRCSSGWPTTTNRTTMRRVSALWKEIAFHVGKLDRGDDWMTATTQRELARVSRLAQASPEELRKWRAGIDAERESVALRDEGNYTAALEAARKAYVYRAELLGDDAPRKATGINNIAVLLDLTGRLEEADRQYDAARNCWKRALVPNIRSRSARR